MNVKKYSFVAVALLVSVAAVGVIVGATLIARADGTVNVTATVAQSVTCSVGATSTSFGTLTTSAVATASPSVTSTLACNDGLGCTLYVQDQGDGTNPGLYDASSTHLIPSAAATLAAGTEGYGIQGSVTTPATGGTLTVGGTYTGTGNTVGALSHANVTLASASAPTTGGVVTVTHLAAISNLTAAGSYSDTITYSCTGN